MEDLENQYGYDDSILLSEAPEYLHCVVCTLILREPVQILACGHKFCAVCYERLKTSSAANSIELLCPVDRDVVDTSDVRPDVAVRRLVGNLLVKCYHHETGCQWTGDLRELDDHTVLCQYKPRRSFDVRSALTGDQYENLQDRLEQCERDLMDKEKEISIIKNEQQQLKDQVQELSQQLSGVLQELGKQQQKQQQQEKEQKQQQKQLQQQKQQHQQAQQQLQQQLQQQEQQHQQVQQQLQQQLQQQEQQHQQLQQQRQQEMQKQQHQTEIMKQRNVTLERELSQLKKDHKQQLPLVKEMSAKIDSPQNISTPKQVRSLESSPACKDKSITARTPSYKAKKQQAVEKKKIVVQHHNGPPSQATISNNNRSVKFEGYGATVSVPGAVVPPHTKVWYEVQCTRGLDWGSVLVGWATTNLPTSTSWVSAREQVGGGEHSYGFDPFSAYKCHKGTKTPWGMKATGDSCVIGVALDLNKGEILYSMNGEWTAPMGVAFTGLPSDIQLFPAVTGFESSVVFNFGDKEFKYGPPDASFKDLNDVV